MLQHLSYEDTSPEAPSIPSGVDQHARAAQCTFLTSSIASSLTLGTSGNCDFDLLGPDYGNIFEILRQTDIADHSPRVYGCRTGYFWNPAMVIFQPRSLGIVQCHPAYPHSVTLPLFYG